MNKNNTLLSLLAVGFGMYAAYKFGEHQTKKKNVSFDEPLREVTDEEVYVLETIEELKKKPIKTQRDRFNIELLEVKLNQLRNQKQ